MAMYIKDTLKASISGNAGTATKLATARSINGTNFDGSAGITTANWGTARTLTIGNKGQSVNGSANVTWSLTDIGAAPASHDHNRIVTRDTTTCETGTNRPAVTGLSMTQVYNNGYPTAYGNTITLRGQGDGQILVGWSGTSGAHAPVYVRSKRDNADASWSNWAQFYTTANKPTASDVGALSLSGGNISGSLHLSTDNTSISGLCGGGTDRWTIQGGGADDNGYLEINTKDNGNEPILCRQYSSSTVSRTAYLLNGDGNTTFPGRIAEQGTWLSDKYAAKSHGHNEIWVKDAPFNSSNDTTANWGGQGVSVSWYPDGTTITNKPNSWGFIFNIGRGTEVHQMWFSQATGTTYHRGGNGSGWSGSWRAMLDSENYSSYAAPASHSHSYLPLSGGTLSGAVQVYGESRFYNTTYSDPWSGQGCAIKATGAIAATGIIKTNQYLQVGSCPLSIQSGAPSCGGVWIQI